jgi:hypothetical protein
LCRNSTDASLRNHYKLCCRILKDVIKEAKKQYYNKQVPNSNNKMKTIWDIIKLVTGKSTTDDVLYELNINGIVFSDCQDIAGSFNNYFLSVVANKSSSTLKVNNNPLDYLQEAFHCPFPSIKDHAVTSAEITKIIESLKTKGCHGYDEISVKILKISSPFIISPLTYISNKILPSGIFLGRLKCAEIKPLFKNGDKKNLSNYRLISLLTCSY